MEWSRFCKKYAYNQGFYQYSQVAKTLYFAMVYIVQGANQLNASGCPVGLRKKDNTWCVVFTSNLWQS